LHYVAHMAQQAFNASLAGAGGGLATWLVLLAIKWQGAHTQSELARAVGIKGATLTHHLDRLEDEGLVRRTRSTTDRRAIRVELTSTGERRFERLHVAALDYDERLLAGNSEEELAIFGTVLSRLAANLAAGWDLEIPERFD
jgi:MarR family transcriptional regulator, transcriptional regulator for hemolysin